ncbi:MAG: hypothetical protein WDZ93_02790 [Candidatus Paceibacterota bacterium]
MNSKFLDTIMWIIVGSFGAVVIGLGWHVVFGPSRIEHQLEYGVSDPERALFGPLGCGNPCVINANSGGVVHAFDNFVRIVQREKRVLVVNGACNSACAILADKARSNVCITRHARFGFHKVRNLKTGARTDPPQSKKITAWVNSHGGFPTEGVLVMKYSEAKQFWRTC